ncbi:MAG: diaminopimelate epimerase [Planctomycetes bacterium]|nr:diaminopimelate epimerase [Planctomycetota bacterium]
MHFTKMHGIGNDYVFMNAFEQSIEAPSDLARKMARRHFGIGSDGLILIGPSEKADVEMRIFNADGSEAEMCGNGIRCVGKYVYDRGVCEKETFRVETKAGVRTIELLTEDGRAVGATVNMGEPGLTRAEIPMSGSPEERAVGIDLLVGHRRLEVTCVSMGNPHCIVPVEQIEGFPWKELGPMVENHEVFPERTNVHFVQTESPGEVTMATWERGSGVTLACGTGASAVCVAMNLLDQTDRKILAHLPGGDLELVWSADDKCVYMTGPAEEVFEGEWPE